MDVFKIKPIPKSYPGVWIQTTTADIPFNYAEFMNSFHKDKVARTFHKPDYVTIQSFTVKKVQTIVIPVLVIHMQNTCVKIKPPVTNTHYTMIHRMVFMNQMRDLLKEFQPNQDVSCDSISNTFSPLSHQLLVKSFLSIDSPYRGLLLYHGLGSGKTCSSITITESLKPYKNIIVMTPASLEMNYIQELKKCGSPYYKTQQHWTWTTKPSEEQLEEMCLSPKDLIKRGRQQGIWIQEQKNPNYNDLTIDEQNSIQAQIDLMIRKQYKFIHYNGMSTQLYANLTANGNPFSNKVVVIDEAHNFVSRIVNQLTAENHTSYKLYELLLSAEKCKILLLTGTPVINYSHEIAILFNMLKGYTKTYSCKTSLNENAKQHLRTQLPDTDMIYSIHDTTVFSQLPDGFVQEDHKAVYREHDSSQYRQRLEAYLKQPVVETNHKLFPDDKKEFEAEYIENTSLKNKKKLIFRMSGLSSYFPDLVQLMPRLNETVKHLIPMSDVQLKEYADVRIDERKQEGKKKSDDDKEKNSNYRILSRMLCNTTYPSEVRAKRPVPNSEDEELNLPNFFEAIDKSNYITEISTYSPKYEEMTRTIKHTKGRHLVYSQYRSIEGINLFAKVLDHSGYTELKLIKRANWELNIDVSKNNPMYVTYVGTKTSEEKEIIRNIFNKNLDMIPEPLKSQVKDLDIQIFMITSAGAEGISLKEVQYVHIMEPYWNPVRLEQVIGRARRICSHKDLPERERFVEVHIYLMVLPKNVPIPEELKKDLVNGVMGTTDEFLFALSTRKQLLNQSIMDCIKKSSIDGFLYDKDYLRIAETDPSLYSYYPDASKDITNDADIGENVKKEKTGTIKHNGVPIAKFYPEREGEFKPLYFVKDDTIVGYIKNLKTLYNLEKQVITPKELHDSLF